MTTAPAMLTTTQPWPIDASGGLLRVLIGPPAAGKSEWCRREQAAGRLGHRLSLDDTRAELGAGHWDQTVTPQAVEKLRGLLDERLATGAELTIDATSTTPPARRTWLDVARKHQVPAVAVILWEPLEVVRERNGRRNHPVPADVVRKYWERVTDLEVNTLFSEGFCGVAELAPVTVGASRAEARRRRLDGV